MPHQRPSNDEGRLRGASFVIGGALVGHSAFPHQSPTTSPPARVPRAAHVAGLIVFWSGRTDPSHSRKFTPWVWLLFVSSTWSSGLFGTRASAAVPVFVRQNVPGPSSSYPGFTGGFTPFVTA